MAENTSTLTIELNTDTAKSKAEALASSISSIGAKLEETLKKFTEFQTKLNAINAKVNINVTKINQITGIQQAVDSYVTQSKIKDINIKVNAKLTIDKITDINQASIDKAVRAYNASVPISRTKVNILSDATIEVAKILGEVKGLSAAMRAFNASTPIARQKVSVLADATIEVAKIVGEPKGIQAAMKAYNATAPIARQKISLIADASVSVMKIVGAVQGVAAAMREYNRSVPITTSLIKVWADAKLFIMNVTGIDGSSIRDAIRNRTTPIEITTPITVVAKRIRIIADPTANVTVIIGQLQAAGAATESVTNKTNQWYRKILDVYLIYRVFDSVMSRIQHLWETGLHLAQIETTMSVITGSLAEANKQTEWLMETSNQIGLNFSNAAGPYAKFAAAAKGMFTSTEIKQMYIDLGKVAVAMHLNKEETNGVFLAIQQMASKGTVSLEELRLQFAERIPGAMAIAAASAGMTMTEFTKKVSSGDLGSSFLKKFLTDLSANFATASELAANSFIGMQSRFENALFAMKASVATSGFMQAVGAILEDVSKFITENKRLFEYFGVFIGDTLTSVYNDLKKLFTGTDFLSGLARIFSSTAESIKSFFNVLSTFEPVVILLVKAIQLLSAAIVGVSYFFQSFKLVILEIEKVLGMDVQDSINQTIKAMDALEKKADIIADSLFDLSETKVDLDILGAVSELRKLQAEIKITESDYKLLTDKFALTIKASKSSFTPTANETVTQSIKQGIDVATPENIDKLNSKVKDSVKNITELGDTVDRLNFDQKGKSLADSLSEYLQLANPDLAKDASRLQKEFNILKESLKLTPADFQPRQVAGKFSEVLDEELASSKVKADILKGNLEAAQADLSRTTAEIDSRIADLQGKRSKLVSTGRGSTTGDPEYARKLDAEINKLKEYKSATEGILTTQIGRLQGEFKNAVDRGNKLDTLLKELLSVQDKSTEGLTANANKLFESQSKITTELEKELGIRDEMVNKTNDLIRKEEQRKKILAIETGNAPEQTLGDLVKARYEAQQQLDRAMQEHKKLAEDAAASKKEELQTSLKVLEVLKSQNAVEGLKALASEKTAASAEVQANVSISTEGMSSNAKDFMEKYKNELAKAAKELNVSPALIAAQAALETGYGKQMVAGTNNLFNVKDFSGKGVKAVDNQTKSNDAYKKYVDMQASFDDYVAKLKRQWPGVVGAQTPEAFGTALKPGKQGGFAEDINYVEKLTSVAKNFGIVSKTNSSITKEATKTQTELNRSYVVSDEVLNKSFKSLEDKRDVAKDFEEQVTKALEARAAALLATRKATRDLESGKLAKFDANQAFQLQGAAALPVVQQQIDEAKGKLEGYTTLVAQIKITQDQIKKNLSGAGITPEETDFWTKAFDEAVIKLDDFTIEAANAKSELDGLTQAKTQFAKLIVDETTALERSTQAMVDELQYGVDFVERLRLSKISPELTIAFDKNKTTRDFLEFTKAAGTSVDGLKETFASVFIAMGDTTKSFTESMADMFDNMVTRMLDASAKLMANGLLDWFQGIQGGGTNAILGAIGTAVSLGVKYFSKTPTRSAPSTAQTGDSSALGIASMRAADVFGRETAFQFDTMTAAKFNNDLKALASVAYDNSKNIVEFLSGISDSIGTTGAASYVKDLFSPIKSLLSAGSEAYSTVDSAITGLGKNIVNAGSRAVTWVSNALGLGSAASVAPMGFAGLEGGSVAGSWSAGVAAQNAGTFAGSAQAAEVAATAPSAINGALQTFSSAMAVIGAMYTTFSYFSGLSDMIDRGNVTEIVSSTGLLIGSVMMLIPGMQMIAGIVMAISAIVGLFTKIRTPNAWINQFNSLGQNFTPQAQAENVANIPGVTDLGEGVYQRPTNKGSFIGTQTALGSIEMSYHEIPRKTDMTELKNNFISLLKIYRQTNNAIASSLNSIDEINGQAGETVKRFLGKLGDGEEKNRIALKQELSDLDTGNMTDFLYSSISARLKDTGTKAGMVWSMIFDNLMTTFKNISGDNSAFAAGVANLASVLAIPFNNLSLQVIDDLTKSIKAPAVGGKVEDIQKELTDNVMAYYKMFAIINDPQFGIGAGVSDTKISGLIATWAKLGLGIEETSNSWIAFVDLFHKSQPTLDVARFESEMTKTWDGLIQKFVDTGLTQVQAVSMTSSAVVGASVLKESGIADKDLLKGGLAFAEAARKAATKNLDAANIAVDDAIEKGKAEGIINAHMTKEQQTAILIRTKAIDQQTAIEADFTVQQAKATQELLSGYGAVFSVVNGLRSDLDGFGITVEDLPQVVKNLTDNFGDMKGAIEAINSTIEFFLGKAVTQQMQIENATRTQETILAKNPEWSALGLKAGVGATEAQAILNSATNSDDVKIRSIAQAIVKDVTTGGVNSDAYRFAQAGAAFAPISSSLTPNPIIANITPVKSGQDFQIGDIPETKKIVDTEVSDAEEFAKKQAENAKTFLGKQQEINDAIADFGASDANKKIMAVNKEIRGLEDAVSELGQGALQNINTLKSLKLGQVYKDLYDSIEPVLEQSNKLGITHIDLATAMTKDQNGLWSLSQSMIDLIPTLKDVVDNVGAYKASLEALDKAQKIIGNSGMSDQAVKVSEIIASALTDLTALSKTPLLSGADSIVNAANIQAGEVFKPIVEELNNIGKSDATKSIQAVSKELAGWREALRLWANSSDYAKQHFEEFSGILDQIETSRLNEIANKLKDIMDNIYTTFNRAQSTRAISANTPIASNLEDKLWGIRDNYIGLINSIIQNSDNLDGTIAKVTDVFNIIQTVSSQALDDAKKELADKFKSIFSSIADAAEAQDIIRIKLAAGFDTKKADEEVYAYQKAALIRKAITAQAAQDYQGQLDAVNEAHNLIMSHYETQKQAIQDMDTFAKGLKDHVKQLLVDNSLSVLTNQQRLNEAAQQYSDIFAAATSTSDTQARTDARGKLTGSADTYLQQARSFYASGAEYTKIFNQVTGQLSGVADVKSPQEQLVDINTSMNTELGVIAGYLETIKNQQILAQSNELTQLQASFAKVASDFTTTLTQLAIEKNAPIETTLKIAVVGDLTDKEVDLITALYTKNPEQVFTATIKSVRAGDLTTEQGIKLFDNFFAKNPDTTFSATLKAVRGELLSTTEGVILFDRMFSADPAKTFTATLSAYKANLLSQDEGLILFNRMFAEDPAKTFSAVLTARRDGLLSSTEGLGLWQQMFAANPEAVKSATLTAYADGLISTADGLAIYNSFNTPTRITKTADVSAKISGDETATKIALGAYTTPSSTIAINSTLAWDKGTVDTTFQTIMDNTKATKDNLYLGFTANIATLTKGFTDLYNIMDKWFPAIHDGTYWTREYTKWTANNIVAQTEALVRRSYGMDGNPTTPYQTFAKGGVTNQPSIFGEAGWEAAVPLPDGRTIPVTVQSAPQQQDNSDVVEAIIRSMRANAEGQKELKAELSEAKAELARLRKQLVQS